MPFEAIELKSMWVMLGMILNLNEDLSLLMDISGPESISSVKALEISSSEGIFLLTALSNMAIARTNIEDRQLIETIANQILEVEIYPILFVYLFSVWILHSS